MTYFKSASHKLRERIWRLMTETNMLFSVSLRKMLIVFLQSKQQYPETGPNLPSLVDNIFLHHFFIEPNVKRNSKNC